MTAGQDGMIAHHSQLNGGVWSDQCNQNKRNQRGALTLEQGLSKSIQSCTTSQVVLAYPDYLKSLLRVTQMLPAIDLDQ